MNIRKSLSRMKIWWGFAEVSTAFVHKGSRIYNHFSAEGTPNKFPYNTTKQLILQNGYTTSIKDMRGPRLLFLQLPSHPATISSHHPNIYTIKDMMGRCLPFLQLPSHPATISSHHPNTYTIKDMRGCHLPFLKLPSHQPKRGERNQCLWFLPHL
jgi:hypothetical protein